MSKNFAGPQWKSPAPPVEKARKRINPRSKKRGTGSRVPAEVVDEVALRSAGWCECRPGCPRRAEHLHHRLPRGRGGADTVDNLLAVHHVCHGEIHAHPERSYRLGSLLRTGQPTYTRTGDKQ